MSADNWTVCPKCRPHLSKDKTAAITAANALYGTVPAAEFMEALAKANALPEEDDEPTQLREDYEIGLYKSGWFEISYSCSCTQCGFSWEFNHRQMVVDP